MKWLINTDAVDCFLKLTTRTLTSHHQNSVTLEWDKCNIYSRDGNIWGCKKCF
jgi:hypothetical protein